MSKLPRHSDIDAELWPGLNLNPFRLFWQLGCVASVMIFIVAWLGLIAVGITGWVDLAVWHFVTLPIAAWLFALALPVLLKSRRGALGILDAIIETCEAWAARAGWSVDLNSDGRIGHYQPLIQPPIIEEHTPIPYIANGQARLLAHQVQAGPGVKEVQPEAERPPAPPLASPGHFVTRHVWSLPNGAKVEQAQLEDFSDRIGLVGWDRGTWVKPKGLEREQYDGAMLLFDQAGIVEGRRKGNKGKLIIKRADQRRRVLGLPLGTVAKPDPPHPGGTHWADSGQ